MKTRRITRGVIVQLSGLRDLLLSDNLDVRSRPLNHMTETPRRVRAVGTGRIEKSELYIGVVPDAYKDSGVVCGCDVLEIRRYYLWGSKKVPYSSIVNVQRVSLSALKGKARLWGTANMAYWANLDTHRTSKQEGLILDLGKRVKPFVTPDDPDRVEAIIRERTGLGPAGPTIAAPFL